ncbi:MAG: diguanylate cyclase [Clostridiales bacterium]|nr:diguanylate cyclase [Clostridiales bacterium]
MEKTRILIVEDEGLIARDIENMVKNAGYEVCGVVSTGEEAVEEVDKTEPDLILMDIVLRGSMDGVEAAERIRTRVSIPVIYLTAHTDENTLERAKLTEPLGYTLKPIEQKELLTVIEMALYKHQMELTLREREGWLTTILQSIGDGVIATDRLGHITFMNPVAEKLTGWRQPESINKPLSSVLHLIEEESGRLHRLSVPRLLNENFQNLVNGNVLIVNYDEKIPVELSAAVIRDQKNDISGLVLVLHDLTERRRYEEKLRHNAIHDHLTELPNRFLFFDRLNIALAQAQREAHKLAVLMLDLDEFKKVNDTWGHDIGDKLLQSVAYRLVHMFRKSDTIARLGGDEFVLLLPEIPHAEVAKNVAERIILSFKKPFSFEGLAVSITASIGISLFPEDGEDADTLSRNADIAMYRAKEDGKNRFHLYSPELRESLRH